MTKRYTINYTRQNGFSLIDKSFSMNLEDFQKPVVSLTLDFHDNPTQNDISNLKQTLKEMETHGKEELVLNFKHIQLLNDIKKQNKTDLYVLDPTQFQAFICELMSEIPKTLKYLRIVNINEGNRSALTAAVQNLPKHITELNLTNNELHSVNQTQFNKALQKTNIDSLILAGALDKYSSEMQEELANNFPNSLDEITIFKNSSNIDKKTVEEDDFAKLAKNKNVVVVRIENPENFPFIMPYYNLSSFISNGLTKLFSNFYTTNVQPPKNPKTDEVLNFLSNKTSDDNSIVGSPIPPRSSLNSTFPIISTIERFSTTRAQSCSDIDYVFPENQYSTPPRPSKSTTDLLKPYNQPTFRFENESNSDVEYGIKKVNSVQPIPGNSLLDKDSNQIKQKKSNSVPPLQIESFLGLGSSSDSDKPILFESQNNNTPTTFGLELFNRPISDDEPLNFNDKLGSNIPNSPSPKIDNLRKSSPSLVENDKKKPTRRDDIPRGNISSTLFFGCWQNVKRVGIVLLAIVAGGLVGTAVGIGVGIGVGTLNPAGGIVSGAVSGAAAGVSTAIATYKFFSSPKRSKDNFTPVPILP